MWKQSLASMKKYFYITYSFPTLVMICWYLWQEYGIIIMYSLLFYMYYYVLIYFFYVFFYFVYLFFLHLYIEWRVMSPCSMQVWPRFSSRVSHNNPHQLGHSRPGLYHYLFLFYFYLFFWEKKISFQTSILLLLH